LEKMLAFHKEHNKMASIVLATVDDPSRFGVVVTDESNNSIKKFVEKPK
jgi:mannose-1-phosphate guanylyltransferase